MLGLLLSLEETVVTVKRGGTSLMVILLSLLLLLFSLSQNHQYCCNCYHHRYAYFNSFSSFLMNGETSLIFFLSLPCTFHWMELRLSAFYLTTRVSICQLTHSVSLSLVRNSSCTKVSSHHLLTLVCLGLWRILRIWSQWTPKITHKTY